MAEEDVGDLNVVAKPKGVNDSNACGESSNIVVPLSNGTKQARNVAQSNDLPLPDGNQGTTRPQVDDIDNDPEVILLTKFRLALGSTLRMLECARDDLVRLGERMDRLTVASQQCREKLEAQQEVQRQQDKSGDV